MRCQIQFSPVRKTIGPPDFQDEDENWFEGYGADNAGKSTVPAQSAYRRRLHTISEKSIRSDSIESEYSSLNFN